MFIEAFIHNCQNLEATKIYPLVGEWTNQLWYIVPIKYYSVLKTDELSSHEKTWRKLKRIHLSERNHSEKKLYILYDSNYITFWKWPNCGFSKKISG